jgi:hypothetical protein
MNTSITIVENNATVSVSPGVVVPLGNGTSYYQMLVTGTSDFDPVYSGFLMDGTTGGKTDLHVTSGKTLTLTAADDYNLTVPATGTVALLGTANVFTVAQEFAANGLTVGTNQLKVSGGMIILGNTNSLAWDNGAGIPQGQIVWASGAPAPSIQLLDTEFRIVSHGGDNCWGVNNTDGSKAAYATDVPGDVSNRIVINVNGDISWGSGIAALTCFLKRTADYQMQMKNGFDLCWGATPMIIGADEWNYFGTRTNAFNKMGYTVTPHYLNAEENITLIMGQNSITDNIISIGGGGGENAATRITLYTGADNTTVTGTARLVINSAGSVMVGTGTDGMTAGGSLAIKQDLAHRGTLAGFYNHAPAVQPTIAGDRGANTALASLITGLAGLGLVVDTTS